MASTILVTVASKYGSTQEVAAFVARVLAERGLHVNAMGIEDVASLDGIDAVVAGSAVYAATGWSRQGSSWSVTRPISERSLARAG